MARLEQSLRLNAPVEEVFAYFLNPAFRPELSPPQVGMVILQGPNPLTPGSHLEFKVQGMGLVQHVIHQITDVTLNELIAERQVKGPLTSFVHRHLFQRDANGGTLLSDEIEFSPPGGILGLLATEDKILDSLEDGFYYREQQLIRRFGKGS